MHIKVGDLAAGDRLVPGRNVGSSVELEVAMGTSPPVVAEVNTYERSSTISDEPHVVALVVMTETIEAEFRFYNLNERIMVMRDE